MNLRIGFISCLIGLLSFSCQGANILILEGVASPSHHLWISKVTTQLAARGHNITSLSADIDKTATPNLHYLHLDKVYDHLYNGDVKFDYIEIGESNPWMQFQGFFDFSLLSCEGAINSNGWKQLQSYPDDFKFDLVIHDFAAGFCHLAFLPKFKYPTLIAFTAFNDISIVTAMMGGVLTPSTSTHFAYKNLKSSFIDRIDNYLMQIADFALRKFWLYPKMDVAIREQGKMLGIPPIQELSSRTKLAMFNYDPAIDTPEQLPSSIIGVGGLQIQPAKPLPEDLQTLLDNAKKGLILFSLGTNVQMHSIGDDRLIAILDGFRKLPEYIFLCKFELENPPVTIPKNVIMRKWIPQNDVLAHKNTKLFITHAGLLSTQESVWHGVPMLGIPIFADQFLNIEKSIRKGIAERILWRELSADNLYKQIKKILIDPSYAENIEIASKVFRDQKETPLERAIWWIEWSIRNPEAKHLVSVGSNFNFIQLQSIDVLAVIFVVILLVLCLLKRIMFKVMSVVTNYVLGDAKSSTSSDKKKQKKNKKE